MFPGSFSVFWAWDEVKEGKAFPSLPRTLIPCQYNQKTPPHPSELPLNCLHLLSNLVVFPFLTYSFLLYICGTHTAQIKKKRRNSTGMKNKEWSIRESGRRQGWDSSLPHNVPPTQCLSITALKILVYLSIFPPKTDSILCSCPHYSESWIGENPIF